MAAPADPTQDASPSRVRSLALAALVALLAALPFLGALDGAFVDWDDELAVVRNDSYRGLDGASLRWAFTSFHMGHYMPLTWLTFALDHALWGLDPRGWHLTSVALHALDAVLVLLLSKALLARAGALSPRATWLASMFAALLFAVHPLRVESVAWITERRDVLSCLFLLATVLAYVRATDRGAGRARWLALALVLYNLSLLSKAWGITLPVVLLVLDLLVLERRAGPRPASWGRLVGEKLLFVPFAALAAWLAAAAQGEAQAIVPLADHGALQRAAQASYGLVHYPLKTLWPVALSPLYSLEPDLDWTRPVYLASMGAVVGITALLVVQRRRWPAALAAWLCYAILVSPVLGLLQSGVQIAADRYTYIACIPLAVAAAALVARCVRGRPGLARLATITSLAFVALLGARAHAQTAVWRDSEAVWRRVVEVEPDSYIGNWMLGVALQRKERHEEALRHLEHALSLRDGDDGEEARHDVGVRFRLALSQLALSRGEAAEATLLEVLSARPTHLPALQTLRGLYQQDGRTERAEDLLQDALREDGQFVAGWLELSDLLLDTGRLEESLVAARAAARVAPDEAVPQARIGLLLLYLERLEPAERALRRALERDPDLAATRVNLAVVLQRLGRPAEARAQLVEALERDPQNAAARRRLEELERE